MEPRLIKPEIIYYKKISYIKSYWYLLLLLTVWFLASQYIAFKYAVVMGEVLLFLVIVIVLGVCPLVAIPMIHFSIIYERKRKDSWKEYERWENEPEIKARTRELYRSYEIFGSIRYIISGLKTLEENVENKELFIIQEKDTTNNYVVIKMSDEDIKNNALINIEDKKRTLFQRL